MYGRSSPQGSGTATPAPTQDATKIPHVFETSAGTLPLQGSGVATQAPISSVLATSAATTSPLLTLHSGKMNSVVFAPRITITSGPKRAIGTKATDTPKSSSNLSEKLVGDVLIGCSVTFWVAPFLTLIDKAIVQKAAGSHTTAQSMAESAKTILRNPVAYMKSPMFLMMWGVYAATYSTANSLKTLAEHNDHHWRKDGKDMTRRDANEQTDQKSQGAMAVFAGTTLVNSASSMLKDKAYATMFGTTGAASKVPLITYGLWASRDCMVIGSSFILPDLVSTQLMDHTSLEKKDALKLAQFACPVATQFIAGPVQLLGLDFYNRPVATPLERFTFLVRGAASVIGARVARIAPGYGIGGIGNTHFRNEWRDMLIAREVRKLASLDEEKVLNRRLSVSKIVSLVAEKDAVRSREKLIATMLEF